MDCIRETPDSTATFPPNVRQTLKFFADFSDLKVSMSFIVQIKDCFPIGSLLIEHLYTNKRDVDFVLAL